MDDKDNLPTWMFASGCTYSFEIKDSEPELILEFDCDRYGDEFVKKRYLDVGYVYAPYIRALEPSEIIAGFDPAFDNPTVEIAKMYHKKTINEKYYSTIEFKK